jgi:hypothetical protein
MADTITFRDRQIKIKVLPLGKLREIKKFIEGSILATFQPLLSDEEYAQARDDWKKFLEMALEENDPSLELDSITVKEMQDLQIHFFAFGMGNLIKN